MSAGSRIVVGVSGGVDSSVAALCLLRAGFEVHALHMTNWEDGDSYCSAAADYQAARRACDELGIPLHRVNFSAEYREQVFADFLREYRAGRTPNPDVLCNRHIKFGHFLDYAERLGAREIATGHYARRGGSDGQRLLIAADRQKDQSYFLHAVDRHALSRTLFPLGDLTKSQVRRLAVQAGLSNHARPDSTGICFIGERPFREFLARYVETAPGPVVTADGDCVGQHDGLPFYTLGQRSGTGIGGRPGSTGLPWYVAGKEPATNTLIVVQGRDNPLLWSRELETETARWMVSEPTTITTGLPLYCEARIRHRHAPAPCQVSARPDGGLIVQFAQPQWAPSPGQYLVLYDGDECLGGAVIRSFTPETSRTGALPACPAPAGADTSVGAAAYPL